VGAAGYRRRFITLLRFSSLEEHSVTMAVIAAIAAAPVDRQSQT